MKWCQYRATTAHIAICYINGDFPGYEIKAPYLKNPFG